MVPSKKIQRILLVAPIILALTMMPVIPAFANGPPTILIDQTHNEFFQPPNQNSLTNYISSLQSNGYTVDILTTAPIDSQSLSGYCAFVIILPQSDFSASEVSAIASFVSNGGGLYLVGNYIAVDTYLNQISVPNYGVTFNSGDTLGWQTITNMAPHQITTGITSFNIYAAGPLNPVNPPSTTIAWENGNTLPVLAVAQSGLGRVVSFVDATPLHNSYWTSQLTQDEIDLQMNIIAWLTETCAPPNDVPEFGLELPMLLSMAAVPLLFLRSRRLVKTPM